MKDISQIETIIVVMFENRSFDHLMGYLSLPPHNMPAEGLKQAADFTNPFNGFDYPIFRLNNPDKKLPDEPPQERPHIATQIDPGGNGTNSMQGFVRSYAQVRDIDAGDRPMVMGFYTADDVPAKHFFATNYGICDHWFASIPTGTQPNRLMAMSGYTLSDINQRLILPHQELVYDWLTKRDISWRVYHQGIPFFMMMNGWHLKVLESDNLCSYGDFQDDVLNDTLPQVVFIEPRYSDAPHFEAPCDDHPPSAITHGQQFLKRIYSDLITNWERWLKTLMIVTYDENGGFFDHVPPLAIPTKPRPEANFTYGPFTTTGPRVPAYLISPFVKRRSVFSGALDQTSILKCIAKRFGDGRYSPEVDSRQVGDIWYALELDQPRSDDADFPPPPNVVGFTPNAKPTEPIPLAFKDALGRAKAEMPDAAKGKFPELFSHF